LATGPNVTAGPVWAALVHDALTERRAMGLETALVPGYPDLGFCWNGGGVRVYDEGTGDVRRAADEGIAALTAHLCLGADESSSVRRR
jgi:hypothetical protein